MDIKIELAKKEEKEILKNLLEKYNYEFSQYDDKDVNSIGLYGYSYLDNYWTENNRFPYFIRVNDKLAGFVMVNDIQEVKLNTNFTMAEFFILYKYRQKGIGKYVVNYILNKYKGKWQLRYHPKNKTSEIFWNKTIEEYTKGNFEIKKDLKESIYKDGTIGHIILFES